MDLEEKKKKFLYWKSFRFFLFWNVLRNYFYTLLRGTKTTRKNIKSLSKYLRKGCYFHINFFSTKKLRFLCWKFSEFVFLELSKRYLHNSSKGNKNNQEKILSSFREILKTYKNFCEKKDFWFWQYFLKKRTFRFFFWEYSKRSD